MVQHLLHELIELTPFCCHLIDLLAVFDVACRVAVTRLVPCFSVG